MLLILLILFFQNNENVTSTMMEECIDDIGGDEGPAKIVDNDLIKQPYVDPTALANTATDDGHINTITDHTVSDNSDQTADNEKPVISNSDDIVKPVLSNDGETVKPVISNGDDTVKPVIDSDTVKASTNDTVTATDPFVKLTDSHVITTSKTSIVHSIIDTVIKVAKNEDIINAANDKSQDIHKDKIVSMDTNSNTDKEKIDLGTSDETKMTAVILGSSSNDDDLELDPTDTNAANMNNNNNASAGLSVADLERQNGELLDRHLFILLFGSHIYLINNGKLMLKSYTTFK